MRRSTVVSSSPAMAEPKLSDHPTGALASQAVAFTAAIVLVNVASARPQAVNARSSQT